MSEKDRLELEQECLLKYSKAQMINQYIDELEENEKITSLALKNRQEADKYKKVLDKIKEYVKNNEKCIVECSGRDFMTGMPYEQIKTGLIEKARIEELLEEIE